MGKFVRNKFVKRVLVALFDLAKTAVNLNWSILTAHPLCDSINSLPGERRRGECVGGGGSDCLHSPPKTLIHQQVQLCQQVHASSISWLPHPSPALRSTADVTEEAVKLQHQAQESRISFVPSRSGSGPLVCRARVRQCVASVVSWSNKYPPSARLHQTQTVHWCT